MDIQEFPKVWRYVLVFGLSTLFGVLVFTNVLGLGVIGVAYLLVMIATALFGRNLGILTTLMITVVLIFARKQFVGDHPLAMPVSLVLFAISGPIISYYVDLSRKFRKQAELKVANALRISEELKTTLRSIADAVIVTDVHSRIKSLNPVASRLLGWKQEEVVGLKLATIFRIRDENTNELQPCPILRVFTEGSFIGDSGRIILIDRSGNECAIEHSASAIREADEAPVGGVLVFRDVSAQREAIRKVEAAEARFREFMDRSPVPAFIKDENGRYSWGNRAWKAIRRGVTVDPISKTDNDLWSAEIAERFVRSDIEVLKNNDSMEFVSETLDKDGKVIYWLTQKFSLGYSNPSQRIGGIAIDISERIRHERQLRESEENYRLLFEANPHPMWLIDGESRRFLKANHAALDHYGYTSEEFLNLTTFDIRPKEDVPWYRDWLKIHKDLPVSHATSRHLKKDGTLIEVEIASHAFEYQGRPARVVLAHDVTDRMRAQRALQVNRERLDFVLNGAQLGLWYCDFPAQKMTLNERAKLHFGLNSTTDVSMHQYLENVFHEDREHVRVAIDRAILNHELFDAEHRIVVGDQPTQWVRVIGRGFYDEKKLVLRFDGISIDITNKKRDETLLREAKEAAVEANNAKTKLLAMLGHELRTPLTPVLASVTAFLDRPSKSPTEDGGWSEEDIRGVFSMIRRNIELETRLIGDLLDISRFERGQLTIDPSEVDIHVAIRQAVDICKDVIESSGLKLRFELDAVNHYVNGDHARLMQIVWNLVHNATKFTTADGCLVIRTRNCLSEVPDHDRGEPIIQPMIEVEFIDSGIGIHSEVLPHIFEPFEQGYHSPKVNSSGLGLGLAISRSIAEAHGGTIEAGSQGIGQGSTFTLRLAVRPIEKTEGTALVPSHLTDSNSPARVLLLEDNPDTLRYLSILLRQRGYIVQTARRVSEAETLLESQPFDMLISDIQLPDGNGLDLMRMYRGKIRGIAVSGFGSVSDIKTSLEAGFEEHLTKPIEMQRLEAAIRQRPTASRA
jgi:PAS domain S-box-containing protein